jgi:hypothetical protein
MPRTVQNHSDQCAHLGIPNDGNNQQERFHKATSENKILHCCNIIQCHAWLPASSGMIAFPTAFNEAVPCNTKRVNRTVFRNLIHDSTTAQFRPCTDDRI